MPLTVAPPPRTGEAAQGPWFADPPSAPAPDHAAAPHDEEPATEPAHPTPAATARTVAAGVLLAALALIVGAIVVAFIAGMRLAFSGDDALSLDGPGLVLLALAFAGTTCLVIIAGTRTWGAPRARTLVLAGSLAIITALCGLPLIAAAVTVLAVGAALAHDRLVPGGRSAWSPLSFAALAAGALTVAVAGAALTDTHAHARAADDVSLDATWDPNALLGDRAAGPGGKEPSAAGGRDAAAGGASAAAATGAGTEARRGADAEAAAGDGRARRVPTPGPGGVAPGLEDASGAAAAPRHAAPAAAPVSAERFVLAYYDDLNAGRFSEAWAVLSPGVRAQLGPFARWKGGYGRTLASEPRDVVVGGEAGGEVAVTHVLVARDRGCAGERSFRVTWRLRANSGGWSAIGLSAVALGSRRC